MFDTTMIAKKIKQTRIDKNMTQMNLADAMGVSYQAVSNWERGNSMPDISKLGDLCTTLGISVNELLGLEESKPNAVTKAMENEELTMEELAEVAPVMLPEDVKVHMKGQRLHISIGDVQVKIGSDPEADRADAEAEAEAMKKEKKLDLSRIADLAPFLDQEYLDELIGETDLSDLDGLDDIAPFLSRATLDKLIMRQLEAGLTDGLEELAPFASRETLDKMVQWAISNENDLLLEELYPFLSREALRKLAKHMMEQKDLDALEDLMPFV